MIAGLSPRRARGPSCVARELRRDEESVERDEERCEREA
jgi:hypothetical protein